MPEIEGLGGFSLNAVFKKRLYIECKPHWKKNNDTRFYKRGIHSFEVDEKRKVCIVRKHFNITAKGKEREVMIQFGGEDFNEYLVSMIKNL